MGRFDIAATSIAELEVEVTGCTRCSRLVEYRERVAQEKKRMFAEEEYWGKPVPGFGDPNGRVLLVGLAPGAHGSNRTGRPFTGDGTDGMGASDFLARALCNTGFASQPSSQRKGDGQELRDLYMTAIVRCAPPGNKPTGDETRTCAPWLEKELELLSDLRVIVALGKLAFDQMLRMYSELGVILPKPKPKFGHGTVYDPGEEHPLLLGSYHPSRQNTQTRLLSPSMLEEVFLQARDIADSR